MLAAYGRSVSRITLSSSKSSINDGLDKARSVFNNCGTGLSGSTSLFKEYHSSPCLLAGEQWRKKHGLSANPNAYGPLTDGPDYSFIDGRPTPPGSGKVKRAIVHKEIAKRIIDLSKEMDFAVELHQQRLKQKEEQKAEILNRKLKPKGNEPS